MKHLLLLLLFLTTSFFASSQETHVFLLAGQSNMVGRPTFDGGATHPPGTLQWGRFGASNNTLIPASIPMQQHDASAGDMGLDVQFAIDYIAANPNVTLVLIPSAKGGTGFNTSGQWRVGDALYNDAVNRTNACMSANPSFIFKGILWHQGERDRNNIPAYYAYYDNLINSMRNDINAADNTTPFICGGLMPDFISTRAATSDVELVQAYIEDTPSRIPHTAYADNAGLTTFDNTHGDAASLRVFGTRYFQQLSNAVNNTCPVTTEFISGSWDNGAPDANKNVIFSQNYDITASNFEVCTCELINNAVVTVGAGEYLKVTRGITVNSGASLLVEHEGIVVQTDPAASVINKGVINVELTTPVLSNRDFMVLGSPMDLETRTGVFNSAFLVLNSTPANFMPHAGVPMGGTNFADDKLINGKFWDAYNGAINRGEGFIVRPQTSYIDPAVTSYDMTYELGTLNNGAISRPIVFNGLLDNPTGTPNILANPYASPISGADLINDNPLINEVYFWEHLTPPSTSLPGSNNMNFSMDDISIYNGIMGTPAANDMSPGGVDTTPNGVISTGQGFAIKAQAGGTVTFENSMRLTSGNTTLRTAASEAATDRLLVEVRNATYGVGSYAGLAFSPEASFSEDQGLDTERLATIVSLYSHYEDGNGQLAIQSIPEFENGMKIPFGFTTQVPSELEYVISLANVEGDRLSNATVYLIDNLLGTQTNLNGTDYTFRSGKQTYDNRFTIQFESEFLGTSENVFEQISLYPNPTSDQINIHSPKTAIQIVTIHDVIGREIAQYNFNGENTVQIDLSALNTAIYFVTVATEMGDLTKRIIKK